MNDLKSLTPKDTVSELDKYIIGQDEAKKSVAIALRNRWRRQQVAPPLRDEIAPKNIIMIGPTGVGKTEIARRLANLAHSPFLKVEASKFTEIGYVGRDVESMIRDLIELAVNMAKKEERSEVEQKAREMAEEKLLDLLFLGGAQCHRHGYRWLIDIAPVLEFVEVAFEGQGDSAHLIIGLGETDRPYPCRSYRSAGTHVVFIGDNSVNQRFPVRGYQGVFHSQILGQFLYDIDVEPLVTVARRVTDAHWVPVAGRTNSQFA